MRASPTVGVWLGLLIAGCAATPAPAPQEYLLRPPLAETVRELEQTPTLALGRVTLPAYLDREGIVLETGDHRIQAAREHRWAEPLSSSLRRMLQAGIARASGHSVGDLRDDVTGHRQVLDVDVHQLHATVGGEVTLAADWQLREPRTGRVLQRHEFVRRTLTRQAGYEAVVEAHAELLGELSRAIAESLDRPD